MGRKPFSTKQKKEQLQKKREKKRNTANKDTTSESESENEKCVTTIDKGDLKVQFASVKLNEQPKTRDKREQNKFNLQFMKESYEELKKNKKNAFKPLIYHDLNELEIEIEDFYKPGSPLDMPLRPKWSYDMTKEQLERNEQKYFNKYLADIFESYPHHELSYFEMNLETWRQLWRVLEISDIILLIVDIRFPALHFSPKFYEHCVENDKDIILVLNKIDLVPTSLVTAWKAYFQEKYPKLHILLFSSAKQIKYRRSKQQAKVHVKKENAPLEKESYIDEEEQTAIKSAAAEVYTSKAHRQLYECVHNIVKTSDVDLTSWNELTDTLLKDSTIKESAIVHRTETDEDLIAMEDLVNSRATRKKFEHGFVTIGCCGFPNVGKSSLLNSLKGRKCVSVSKTPGHTKHLQTIFLTKNVRLCDCPGLVFPSLSGKPLQVLAGIYPIAQLQEPYSAIRYLAENIPMIENLNIQHPEAEDLKHDEFYKDKVFDWTPSDICEAWAKKRGYFTAKAARPDVYRAANELLRMALDGRLCLSLKPKNYFKDKAQWEQSAETKQLEAVLKEVEVTVKEKLEKFGVDGSDYVTDDDEVEDGNNFAVGSDSQKSESESDHEQPINPYSLLDNE